MCFFRYTILIEAGSSFIILYTGSQGSTWLVETLSEYNGVCIAGNELIDRVKVSKKRLDLSFNSLLYDNYISIL
jgi:hypothetical protein